MQFCQNHWDMLREEVISSGMGNLISGNGEVAVVKMVGEIKDGEDTKENFDPLMRCHWMIVNRSLDYAGPQVFTEQFGCPICFFNNIRNPDGSCPCTNLNCPAKEPGSVPDFETWIKGPDSCVASVKEYVTEKGWL